MTIQMRRLAFTAGHIQYEICDCIIFTVCMLCSDCHIFQYYDNVSARLLIYV